MRLHVSILFVYHPRIGRKGLVAECTVDLVCLRTVSAAKPTSNCDGLFEWEGRKGDLLFSNVKSEDQTLKVGFFEQNEDANSENPLGFCKLSGNSGVEKVPIIEGKTSEENSSNAPFACFYVKWLPDEEQTLSSAREYSILISIKSVKPTVSSRAREEEEKQIENLEKFWFSATYCLCDIRTEYFSKLDEPNFANATHFIGVKGSSFHIKEFLYTSPLVMKLNSSFRGLLGIIVVTYPPQSSTSMYFWKRTEFERLVDIEIGLELSQERPNVIPELEKSQQDKHVLVKQKPSPPVLSKDIVKIKEDTPDSPPPPPPPPPIQPDSLNDLKNRFDNL